MYNLWKNLPTSIPHVVSLFHAAMASTESILGLYIVANFVVGISCQGKGMMCICLWPEKVHYA